VWEYDGNERHHYTLDAADFGLPRVAPSALLGGDAADNASITKRVLDGEQGAARDVVVLNAAAAIRVAGIAPDMAEAVVAAQVALDTGATAHVVERWRTVATDNSVAALAEDR